MRLLEIKLPDDTMATLPTERGAMVAAVKKLVEQDIDEYDQLQQQKRGAPFNGPLAPIERATILDYVMRRLLGAELHSTPETVTETTSGKVTLGLTDSFG